MEPVARLCAGSTGLIIRAWFWSTFLVGVLFACFMPPFQTNDETHHWDKLYTVMQLDRECKRVPAGVDDVIGNSVYEQIRGSWKWEFRRFDDDFATHLGDQRRPSYKQACAYTVTAYALPALIARVSQLLWPTQWGEVIVAFYAARLGNWIVLTLCVWLGLRFLPRLRTWLLAVYSVPMVIHQSASINQDSTIIGLHIVLLIVLFRARPLWKLIGVFVIARTLTELKPVFAPLHLFLLIPLWDVALQLGETRRRQIFLGLTAVAALAFLSSPLWLAAFLRRTCGTLWSVSWANSARQTELMISRPWIVVEAFKSQFRDNLNHGHLTGGFTSITAVFGWAQYEVPCYVEVLKAAALALLADMVAPVDPAMAQRRAEGWLHALWCRVVPALAPLLVIILVDLGFYLFFTVPGSKFIIGVQGRYYFAPLLLIGAGLAWWGAGDIERLTRWLSKYTFPLPALRALVMLLLVGGSFYEMFQSWLISYDSISTIYYHHYSPW
jgi:hypothetical protein